MKRIKRQSRTAACRHLRVLAHRRCQNTTIAQKKNISSILLTSRFQNKRRIGQTKPNKTPSCWNKPNKPLQQLLSTIQNHKKPFFLLLKRPGIILITSKHTTLNQSDSINHFVCSVGKLHGIQPLKMFANDSTTLKTSGKRMESFEAVAEQTEAIRWRG